MIKKTLGQHNQPRLFWSVRWWNSIYVNNLYGFPPIYSPWSGLCKDSQLQQKYLLPKLFSLATEMFIFKFPITCGTRIPLLKRKSFFNKLFLMTVPITLRNLQSFIWDRIQKLWIDYLTEWWDDALWDSIPRLTFTLLSEVIRNRVNTAGT